MSKATTKPKYRVLIGLDYKGKRSEPGSTRSDLPEDSIKGLIKQGAIELVDEKDGV